MSYVAWNKIRGVNGSSEVIGADEPISINDLPRLGYPNAQHAWDCMLAHGDIVPVGATTAPRTGLALTASGGAAADQALEPVAGESDLEFARRVAPTLRAHGAEHAATAAAPPGPWQMEPNPAWQPADADRDLAMALAASDAFDARKKAEADATSRAAPAPTRAPAPDPSRSWVRP